MGFEHRVIGFRVWVQGRGLRPKYITNNHKKFLFLEEFAIKFLHDNFHFIIILEFN